ncbi:hypothetical protein TMatcc_010508 [Talaromyces marneffei ATCC 18224]|uniref:alcohol O-acetyltransferase n=2 Tax=Talaromyces marneffei TaxID=37727 RepID=B6QVD9_TALMQ|nr:uncharacterized protein EYB26_009703 [Talaromyces marneffei]EEA18944.1 hydrolase, alpha/beta fold family protein [Talaromyces marneffei ATCC 18224]KAE8548647.1 hypothetical protein EYB25_009028 [Talaromyces marneffei]QGA21989.1 hypothetical protein EYB26_009703 [Talaromyces marneffei]
MSVFSRFFPQAQVSLVHCEENQVILTAKNDKTAESEKRQIRLIDLAREATPATCNLNPLLFNGHLQTGWTTIKETTEIPIYYKRKIFEQEIPALAGQFAVDFVVPAYPKTTDPEATDEARKYTLPSGLPARTTFFSKEELAALPSNDTKPMLVALHGLTGGSHEVYLRAALAPLVLDETAGWEACVVNGRGCAQMKLSTPLLFNARATWDVRQVIKWLRKTFPNRPLFGIGFSLGANILVNYLGEEGENCLLNAAVICANPWNLDVTNIALRSTWLGAEVYSAHMAVSLVNLFNQHVDELTHHPRLNVDDMKDVKYIHEFDRAVQCALWGYPTEGAYHRDASSTDSLLAIRIPFLAINAEDDPISVKQAIPYDEFKQTPYGVLLTTSWGGHLGWFELGGCRWFTKPAANFLNLIAKTIDLSVTPMPEKDKEGLYGETLANGSIHKPSHPSVFYPVNRKLSMTIDN